MPTTARILTALALTLHACAGSDSYTDDWGTEDLATGKADGLLDDAPLLALDQVGTGYVEGAQLDVYAIDLRHGAKISIVQTVTEGDLAPHFTLYLGGSVHVASTSFQRTATRITKAYTVTATGRHYIAVKPYQGAGAGRYQIVATCTADCNGTPLPPEPLDVADAGRCIGKARACSFAKLPSFNGAVGAARARSIFEGCIASDAACAEACTTHDGAQALCDDIIAALPFYADQSAACHAVVASCMTDCYESGGDDSLAEEIAYSSEGVCWENGFNGTCDSYARGHVACGGTYADGSHEDCMAHCKSTIGAWTDDLDTICNESC